MKTDRRHNIQTNINCTISYGGSSKYLFEKNTNN